MPEKLSSELKFNLAKSLDNYSDYLFSLSKENLVDGKIVLHKREASERLHLEIKKHVIEHTQKNGDDYGKAVSLLISCFNYIAGKDFEIDTKFYRYYEKYLNF